MMDATCVFPLLIYFSLLYISRLDSHFLYKVIKKSDEKKKKKEFTTEKIRCIDTRSINPLTFYRFSLFLSLHSRMYL